MRRKGLVESWWSGARGWALLRGSLDSIGADLATVAIKSRCSSSSRGAVVAVGRWNAGIECHDLVVIWVLRVSVWRDWREFLDAGIRDLQVLESSWRAEQGRIYSAVRT